MSELPKDLAVVQPRARGEVRALFVASESQTHLKTLRQSGSLRALFPRAHGRDPQMVLTNTSGGVTGGDRFRTVVEAGPGSNVTVTTQAAERGYRAMPGQVGRVTTQLNVADEARMSWLPQETILFDGCAFERRLHVEVAAGSTCLVVEPVVFGRAAMGETVRTGMFDDRVELTCEGAAQFIDRTRLAGEPGAILDRPAVSDGACAAALVLFASPHAAARLDRVRSMLPNEAGASLATSRVLVVRLVAKDGFDLRRTLLPLIEFLHDQPIPRPWMI